MNEVYAGAENIISSLGFSMEENLRGILDNRGGIAIDNSLRFSNTPVPLSLVDRQKLEHTMPDETGANYTLLEKMFIASINDSLGQCALDITSDDCLFIFTTTKGNIELLNTAEHKHIDRRRIMLMEMAQYISSYFKKSSTPVVVSNACVSGVIGLIYASRLIRSGKIRHAVVSGGDLVSEFIVSGFQSFQSLSPTICRPFDKDRDGLTLGEGCGTIVLSCDPDIFDQDKPVRVLGGASSNDANHISGPSRSGEGLQIAIRNALKLSTLEPSDVDTISAHGTATEYNDEMEAKAFSSAGLAAVPLNSYKGYIGHTLGAAGVIETAIAMQSLKKDTLIRSAGYQTHGVSKDINVISQTRGHALHTCLKTGSGFGGSNAAVVIQK